MTANMDHDEMPQGWHCDTCDADLSAREWARHEHNPLLKRPASTPEKAASAPVMRPGEPWAGTALGG